MHYYKKINRFFYFLAGLFFFLCLPLETFAGSKIVIKNAEIVGFEDDYFLNASAEVKFNDDVEQLLFRGFELSFILEFQLATPRKYWFDDEIVTISYPMTLSYHPLSRQYLMTQAGVQRAFATLQQVANEFANLRKINVIKKSDIENDVSYKALLLLRLDNKKLPKTIQDADDNPTTIKMKSQLFEWVPNLSK